MNKLEFKKIEVVEYSGYRSGEYPKSFLLGDKELSIVEIIDRWYEPDHSYFKVRAEDNILYIIRLNTYLQYWELHRVMK